MEDHLMVIGNVVSNNCDSFEILHPSLEAREFKVHNFFKNLDPFIHQINHIDLISPEELTTVEASLLDRPRHFQTLFPCSLSLSLFHSRGKNSPKYQYFLLLKLFQY
ncbi:hypothetical protein IC582_012515 [Cucumis melo]